MIQYKLYRHIKKLIPAGLFFFIFITGCEDPSSSNTVDAAVQTLQQSSLGGKEGEVQSYFFNFNKLLSGLATLITFRMLLQMFGQRT